MGSVGEGRSLVVDGGLCAQPQAPVAFPRRRCQLGERDLGSGGSHHPDHSPLQHQVGLGRLQMLGGQAARQSRRLGGGGVDGGPGGDRRPAGHGRGPGGLAVGVAQFHPHRGGIDSQVLGHDPGVDGGVALALRRGAHLHQDLPVRSHPHPGRLVGADPGVLHVGGHPDPAAPAPGGRLPATVLEAIPVGPGQGQAEALVVVAAVVDHPPPPGELDGDLVGEPVAGDEVAPSHLGPVEVEAAGDGIHHPLHGEHGVGPGCAPNRRRGNQVGVHDLEGDVDGGHYIGPGSEAHPRHGGQHPVGDVGAVVVDHGAPQPEQASVPGDGRLQAMDLIARLEHGGEVLPAGLDPLDGTAEEQRQASHHVLLGIHSRLGPETTPDVGRHHPDRLGGETQVLAQEATQAMGGLGRRPHGQPARLRVGGGHHSPRLHRDPRSPVLAQGHPDDVLGGGEGAVDVAEAEVQAGHPVGAAAVMDRGSPVRRGSLQARHRRQRLVVDHHLLGGVDRQDPLLRHHHRHRLTDVAHLVRGEGMPLTRFRQGGRGMHVGHRPSEAEVGGHVCPYHPGGGGGAGDLDGSHQGMRLRGAHEDGVHHPGEGDVVDVAPPAGDEPGVLDPTPDRGHGPTMFVVAHGAGLRSPPLVSSQRHRAAASRSPRPAAEEAS